MATKFRQNKAKLHRFQFCTRYRDIFPMNNIVLESANSNRLSEFSEMKGSCHDNQIGAKINRNCSTITLLMIKKQQKSM